MNSPSNPPRYRPRWGSWLMTVVSGAVAVLSLAMAADHHDDVLAARSADTCPPGSAVATEDPSCLVPVDGAVVDRRAKSGRGVVGTEWLFRPVPLPAADPPEALREEVWLDLPDADPDEWSSAQQHLFAGRPVQALFWGTEPAAFATPGGRVVADDFSPGREMLLLWGGLAAASLALLVPVASWVSRRDPARRPTGERARLALLGSLPIGGLFGSLAAMVPSALTTQVTVALSVVASVALLVVLPSLLTRRRPTAPDLHGHGHG